MTGPASPLSARQDGDVGVVVLHAVQLDPVQLERVLGRQVLGVQVVGDHLRLDANRRRKCPTPSVKERKVS